MSNIEKEILSVGRVIDYKEIRENKEHLTGPESIYLRDIDTFMILVLCH
jgi:hypothetical protein